jgi:succinoglycan biosynthesis transport protein ExoP
LTTIVLLTALPTVYGLLVQPKYTAVASVMIAPRASRVIDVGDLDPERSPDAAAVETQVEILQSRGLIMLVTDDLHLFNDPEFQDPEFQVPTDGETGASGTAAALWTWVTGITGSAKETLHTWWMSTIAALGMAGDQIAPEVPAMSEEQQAKETAATIFGNKLDVIQSGKAYVLQVAFTSIDPVKAAKIANRLTELYVEKQLQNKLSTTQKANLWLTDRLRTQQQEVLDAEQTVAEFRSKYQFVAGKGVELTETRLDQLNRALIETRAAEAEKQAKLQLVSKLKASGSGVDTIAEAIASPLISELHKQEAELIQRQGELSTSYGANHPLAQANREEMTRLSARITDELDRIVVGLRNELTVLSTQERALEREFEAAKAQSGSDNQAGVHLDELERVAAAKRTLYETLLNRYQETSAQ